VESNDGIGFPELQKSMKEHRNRYHKTTFHEITEHNGFKCTFERIIFSFAYAPLDHSLTLKKTHILQFLYSCFRHFASAPARGKIGNCFIIDFGFVLLWSHLKVMSCAQGLREGLMDGELRAQAIGKFGSKFDGGQE